MAVKKITLKDAKTLAKKQGLANGKDFHALTTDEKLALKALLGMTKYTQAPASKASGKSKPHSFYMAINRK